MSLPMLLDQSAAELETPVLTDDFRNHKYLVNDSELVKTIDN